MKREAKSCPHVRTPRLLHEQLPSGPSTTSAHASPKHSPLPPLSAAAPSLNTGRRPEGPAGLGLGHESGQGHSGPGVTVTMLGDCLPLWASVSSRGRKLSSQLLRLFCGIHRGCQVGWGTRKQEALGRSPTLSGTQFSRVVNDGRDMPSRSSQSCPGPTNSILSSFCVYQVQHQVLRA